MNSVRDWMACAVVCALLGTGACTPRGSASPVDGGVATVSSSSAQSSSSQAASSAGSASSGGSASSAVNASSAAVGTGTSSSAGTASSSSSVGCPWEDSLVTPDTVAARGQLLQTRMVMVLGQPHEARLLKLPTADGRFTYAEWLPPDTSAGARPAILLTMPYDGIDWTGEAVDARWAAQCPTGSCALPDADGPGGGPDAGVIVYSGTSADTFAQNNAGTWAYHNVGVLGVFGRFYAGAGWWAYAQDMVAGLRFLGTQDSVVDTAHVGVLGGSLGGYEAFYAAAYAPADVQPAAVVPMFPPVDVEGEIRWALTDAPAAAMTQLRRDQFAAFFDPYVRRVVHDTGGLPGVGDYRCFSVPVVVPRVTGDVLLVQDGYDLLVDPRLTTALLGALGTRGTILAYLHDQPPDVDGLPLDHGPFDTVAGFPSRDTFAAAFLLNHLMPGQPRTVPIQTSVLMALFTRWRDQSRAGLAQPGAAERLADLAQPGVSLFEMTDGTILVGADGVAAVLQNVWGVTVAAADAATYLRTHGLPP